MSSDDIQKSVAQVAYNFFKYLAFTYFILLWSEMMEMTRLLRHCYSIIDKAVDQWTAQLRACVKANGHHFEHLLWTTGSFQGHPTTKQALYKATHSLLKKTLHFRCLACGSLLRSVSTQ